MCEGMIEVRLDVYGEMLGGSCGIWAAVREGMKEFCGIQWCQWWWTHVNGWKEYLSGKEQGKVIGGVVNRGERVVKSEG